MPFSVRPHMIRHACGFKLANDGQDTRALQHYLGHKNIQHTVRYTELSPQRFRDLSSIVNQVPRKCHRNCWGRHSVGLGLADTVWVLLKCNHSGLERV
jgi:site-specific recombinase XerC